MRFNCNCEHINYLSSEKIRLQQNGVRDGNTVDDKTNVALGCTSDWRAVANLKTNASCGSDKSRPKRGTRFLCFVALKLVCFNHRLRASSPRTTTRNQRIVYVHTTGFTKWQRATLSARWKYIFRFPNDRATSCTVWFSTWSIAFELFLRIPLSSGVEFENVYASKNNVLYVVIRVRANS